MINIDEFEKAAKSVLSQMAYDYYSSGACDEITVKHNRDAYENIYLIPRVLTGNFQRSLSTTILEQSISSPIIIAPSSFHGMASQNAEIDTAKAAKQTETLMIASTMANISLENIASEHDKLWFQLYILNDREATLDLIKRAESSGYKAIVLTIDSQVLGIRYKDMLNNFELPKHLEIKNLSNSSKFNNDKYSLKIDVNANGLFDKKISWKDVEWLKSHTKLPIILKGILHTADVKIAIQNEVDAIIVSNHGGRQLDTAIPTITALPAITETIDGKIPLMMDGGIRRGTDIFKAIALGADAVLIGRPILWGLATNSSQGVIEVLKILINELDVTMALCGFSNIHEIKMRGKDILYRNK